jgi:invasion protein IalB
MKHTLKRLALTTALAAAAGSVFAQNNPITVGEPLGTINEAGQPTRMSDNVKVFGSFRFAESCTFDPQRNLILAMNAGVAENLEPNDGYVSLIHPDGSVHTTKWIGANRDNLTLNHPLGSAIQGGSLYTVDQTVIRRFDLATGQPTGAIEVPGATLLNGIAVTSDGTAYVTNTRDPQRVFRVTQDGQSSVFVEGAPLNSPNGIAIDPDGNITVVNIGDNAVITFDANARVVRTEHAAESGNDGLVILPNGIKYVSSVRFGSVSRIRPGQPVEVIAQGIPSAASMCYDSVQNQLVIPMNNHNALAFIKLD